MNNTEEYTVEVAETTKDPSILINILRRNKDDIVSYYAASNPNCPPEILAEVLKRNKDDNVSWNAAENPNCPPEVLVEVLKRNKDDSVSWYAAQNPNCPPEALAEVLKRNKDDNVSYYAAENLNCPPEALAEVLKRNNNDVVSWNAAQNPNCPPEALAEVLKRNKNDGISQLAAQNPKCPPLAKIRWMQNTGKIAKEDPKKHYIEYEEEKPDKDLEELKKLISSNTKYKIAQYQKYPIWLAEQLSILSNNYTRSLPSHYSSYIPKIEKWVQETNPNLSDFDFDKAIKSALAHEAIKVDEYSPEQIRRNMNSFIANSQNINPDAPNFAVDIRLKKIAIPQSIKNKINKKIHGLGNYHSSIPINEIFNICKEYNVIPIQENGAKWEGFLIGGAECGSEEAKNQQVLFNITFKINEEYMPSKNNISLSWCKLSSRDESNYEIVCYIS